MRLHRVAGTKAYRGRAHHTNDLTSNNDADTMRSVTTTYLTIKCQLPAQFTRPFGSQTFAKSLYKLLNGGYTPRNRSSQGEAGPLDSRQQTICGGMRNPTVSRSTGNHHPHEVLVRLLRGKFSVIQRFVSSFRPKQLLSTQSHEHLIRLSTPML